MEQANPPEKVKVTPKGPNKGPKYFVNIEGEIFPWEDNTITTEEIAAQGGFDPSKGVIEVNKDGDERTLAPDEVVEIKPGHSFGKKLIFKRG
jgi:hypothetical protein